MNKNKETTCDDNPAIIMLTPDCLLLRVSAVEAMAPPTACNTSENRSKHIKAMV